MIRLTIAACALIFAVAASAAPAEETITGKPVALDGDTLRFVKPDQSYVDVRLWGIDAPEMSAENGHGWFARDWMDRLLDALPDDMHVVCTVVDKDRYDRSVATCAVGGPSGADIGHVMIGQGWAVEDRKYTHPAPNEFLAAVAASYKKREKEARIARVGRWAEFSEGLR